MSDTLDYMADWCEELRLRVLKATGVDLTVEELYEIAVQTCKKVREKEHGATVPRFDATNANEEPVQYWPNPHLQMGGWPMGDNGPDGSGGCNQDERD